MKALFDKAKSQFQLFPQVLSLLWSASPKALFTVLFLSGFSGLLTPLNLHCSRSFLDSIVVSTTSQGNLYIVPFWLMSLLTISFVSTLLSTFIQTARADLSDAISVHVIDKTLNKYTKLPAEVFEKKDIYDKLHMAMAETSNRCTLYVDMISNITRACVSLAGVFVILASFDFKIIIVLFCIHFPLLKLQTYLSTRKYALYNKQAEGHRLGGSLIAILLNATNIPELKILNSGEYIQKRLWSLLNSQNTETRKERHRVFHADVLSCGITNVVTFAIKMWIICSALIQQQTVGSIYQLLNAADSTQSLLHSLIMQISLGHEQSLYITNLFDLWSLPDENFAEQEELATPINEISFRNVSFVYPGATTYALKNVNLTFTKGNMYAIVGTNGSGKSTLMKLLCGLYSPTSGTVLINGRSLSDWTPSSLRRQIAAMFQNPIHYPFDVETNIKMGVKSTVIEESIVRDASQKAQANIFIQQLPQQYKTQLCKEWKNGVDLSGGQWQKIALARFFLTKASLKILDEPFSSIDPLTERKVMSEIEPDNDTITILITHRYDMLKKSHHIVLMDDGTIDFNQIDEQRPYAFFMQYDNANHIISAHSFSDIIAVRGYGVDSDNVQIQINGTTIYVIAPILKIEDRGIWENYHVLRYTFEFRDAETDAPYCLLQSVELCS